MIKGKACKANGAKGMACYGKLYKVNACNGEACHNNSYNGNYVRVMLV
jgi:hypothetical protein